MSNDKNQPYGNTEKTSRQHDAETARMPHPAEPEEPDDGPGVTAMPSPEGDAAGENRVTTSISED